MDKIAAGIVLYNPDAERFHICINKLLKQIDRIYVFDNSDRQNVLVQSGKVVYISEEKNKGIAYALNQIMETAKKDGYDWVITMDQDSLIPDGMVTGFENSMKRHNNVGIICPQVIDKRRSYIQVVDTVNEEYVDFCITSAACTSIEAWEKCGKFDEWLFIDLVDNDFCKRLTLSGYKILKLNRWILDQEFGKIIPKSDKVQKIWIKVSKILHNQNFAKFSYKKFVSPMRVYYTNRNIIYLNKKMKKYGKVGYENYNCRGYVGFIVSFMLPSILRAQDKKKVIRATIQGIKDGRDAKVREWSF